MNQLQMTADEQHRAETFGPLAAGHHADGGGIQNHSTSPAYPFILACRGETVEVWAPGGGVIFSRSLGDTRESRRAAWRAGADAAIEAAEKLRNH